MHVFAHSPTPSYSSSGRGNEILAAGIASLFLSPPSKRPSLSSSTIPINRIDSVERSVPHSPGIDVRSIESNRTPALGSDAVKSTHLNFAERTGGGFDVTQLPVEIICEIFEKFVEDDLPHPVRDDTPLPLVSHTCRSDPTKLGQICSRWRAVAVNQPTLWSNILIYNPKRSQVYVTEVWLERSGNTPLNLEIGYDTGKRNYDLKSAAQILQSFIAHLGRWRKLHLNMSIELLGPLYAIIRLPHRHLILESLQLNFYNSHRYNHAEDHIDEVWKYFHGCPSLRRVVWSGEEFNNFPKHAPFQLTHVHARFCVSIDDILSFLPRIPLIQELQIEALRLPSKNNPVTVPPPLVLQHLRLLRIRSHEVPATSLIGSLTCPSLETLIIIHSNLRTQSNQDLQELTRFLHRSGCRLQKLDLRDSGTNIADDELKRCLSDSPFQSLKSLYLNMDHISDQIVGVLSSQSPAGLPEFAPFLEILDLPSCETSDGLLARMVSPRWYEALDERYATPLGHLRKADIFPRKDFGPIDKAFFTTHILC